MSVQFQDSPEVDERPRYSRLQDKGQASSGARRSSGQGSGFLAFVSHAMEPIPLEERVLLNPYQKLVRHGRIPWKILLHLSILVLVTLQADAIYQGDSRYTSACIQSWSNAFLPDSERKDGWFERFIYEYHDVKDSLNTTVQRYYNFNKHSVDYIKLPTQSNNTVVPVKLNVTRFTDIDVDRVANLHHEKRTTVVDTYTLTEADSLGPLDAINQDNIDDFFQKLKYFELSFQFSTFDILSNPVRCWHWKLKITYDFQVRGGRILQRLRLHPETCKGEGSRMDYLLSVSSYPWIVLSILGLATVSLVLTVRGIYRSYKAFQRSSEQARVRAIALLTNQDLLSHEKRYDSTKNLPLRDRMRMFNLWLFLTFFQNLFNIIASVYDLAFLTYSFDEQGITKILIGLSSFLTWIRAIQYFEYFPKYYLLVNTLRRAVPSVLRFVAGTGPLYIGYALFGMIVFGSYSDRFSTFNNACRTLFSILNGDVILESFESIQAADPVINFAAHFYMYTFICLFIYCVLNIFIIIVEDAFYTVKRVRREQKMKQREERRRQLMMSRSMRQAGTGNNNSGDEEHHGMAGEDSGDELSSEASSHESDHELSDDDDDASLLANQQQQQQQGEQQGGNTSSYVPPTLVEGSESSEGGNGVGDVESGSSRPMVVPGRVGGNRPPSMSFAAPSSSSSSLPEEKPSMAKRLAKSLRFQSQSRGGGDRTRLDSSLDYANWLEESHGGVLGYDEEDDDDSLLLQQQREQTRRLNKLEEKLTKRMEARIGAMENQILAALRAGGGGGVTATSTSTGSSNEEGSPNGNTGLRRR